MKNNYTEKAFKEAITEDHRPWGKFRRYPHENAGSIKIITVDPGAALSLQMHETRSEYWVILDAGLEMTVGDKVWTARADEEIYIPVRTAHRVRNRGTAPARIMEIWIGRSSEADVIRLKDDYGRS